MQVPVCSAALALAPGEALGISLCDPGPGLDLTRDLEVWVRVAWIAASQPVLELQAGEGWVVLVLRGTSVSPVLPVSCWSGI